FGELRPTSRHQLELLERALSVTHHCQRRSQLVSVGRLVWCELDAFSKVLRRRGPLPFVECARSSNLIGHGTLEKRIQLLHEGIGRADLSGAAPSDVSLGLFAIAGSAICQRERVMNEDRVFVDGKSLFQIVDRATEVLPRQRRTSKAEQRRHRAWILRK